MREVLFYRWRVPDERRPGKFTITRHRLTVEELPKLAWQGRRAGAIDRVFRVSLWRAVRLA